MAESILERIADWPEQAVEKLVDSILEIEQKHVGVYKTTDDQRRAILRGFEEMRQGKFASDEEVAAVFHRYR